MFERIWKYLLSVAVIGGLAVWGWIAIGGPGTERLAGLPEIPIFNWNNGTVAQSRLSDDRLHGWKVLWGAPGPSIIDADKADHKIAVLWRDKSGAEYLTLLDDEGNEQGERVAVPGAVAIALAPDAGSVALVICRSQGCQLGILVPESGGEVETLPVVNAAKESGISWRPDGAMISYANSERRIVLVDPETGTGSELAVGTNPAYSRDGTRISADRDGTLVIIDSVSGETLRSLRKPLDVRCEEKVAGIIPYACAFSGWNMHLTRLRWSVDSRFLFFAEEDAKRIGLMDCWVMESETGAIVRVGERAGWCGPW